MNLDKKYYAKLMLAGEYGVIVGSEALTVPLNDFYAQIALPDDSMDPNTILQSVSSLRELFHYIQSLPDNSLCAVPKIEELDDMLKKGYFIHSTIPEGYGIGSSGAVSALIYDQFFEQQKVLDLKAQRQDLALIESFFHGKSSGVDAMSCYSGHPLHFLSGGEIIRIETDPIHPPQGYRFFLLDSGQVLKTDPLVKIFLNNMKKVDFKNEINENYFSLIQKFIGTLKLKIDADPALIFRAISDFQWNHFRDMIPDKMEDSWIEGQVSNSYYLKLNGSGGGFMLGIAHENSKETVEGMLEEFGVIWV